MRDVMLGAIAVAASTFAGQEYRSSVELVTVPLTVTGRGRALVSAPLTASDFRVFEDGVEQHITLLDRTAGRLRPIIRSKLTE